MFRLLVIYLCASIMILGCASKTKTQVNYSANIDTSFTPICPNEKVTILVMPIEDGVERKKIRARQN